MGLVHAHPGKPYSPFNMPLSILSFSQAKLPLTMWNVRDFDSHVRNKYSHFDLFVIHIMSNYETDEREKFLTVAAHD